MTSGDLESRYFVVSASPFNLATRALKGRALDGRKRLIYAKCETYLKSMLLVGFFDPSALMYLSWFSSSLIARIISLPA